MLVFITGASSGIGAELCRYYAGPNVTLCLLAHNAGMDAVAKDCEARGAKIHIYIADVTDAEKMKHICEAIIQDVGLPDIVIANAGIRGLDIDKDKIVSAAAAYQTVMVNYIGVVNTFAPFIDMLIRRRTGQLAVIASTSAFRATPNSGIYSASKAAVQRWAEGLRLKLMPYKISVTCVYPGFVKTPMTDQNAFYMPGLMSARRAAEIIAKGIAARKRDIVFPWIAAVFWYSFRAMPGPFYDWFMIHAKKMWPHHRSEDAS